VRYRRSQIDIFPLSASVSINADAVAAAMTDWWK